jgi:predicted small secreted protein
MTRLKVLAGSAVAPMVITGCNTIAGPGKDLQAAGSAISATPDEERGAVINSDGAAQTASACDGPAGAPARPAGRPGPAPPQSANVAMTGTWSDGFSSARAFR